jgi:pimeloyl-ACP methyl ester carboxylesterase
MHRLLRLPDGRDLEIHEHGVADGPLIVFHNGTPVAGPVDRGVVADAEAQGARIVGITRPGYARSTRKPGRAVADIAQDTRAVLDDLGVERCVTWGISGGGPHALACAALLADRVAAAASLAAVAPYGSDGLDFMAGMGEANVAEFGAAVEGEGPLREFIEAELPGVQAITGGEIAEGLASLVSEADKAALTGEYADDLAAGLRDAVSTGGDGWIDDDLAFTKPWGFAPEDIDIPVMLWQGDQDLMVPPTHGAWLAQRIPGVDAHLTREDGHLTLVAHRVPEVHAWLLDRL